MAHAPLVFAFLRRWFRPRKRKVAGVKQPPQTLVSRIDQSIADADMIRLAQESIRRGFPDQAEAAYVKAARLYGQHGMHRKAVAVQKALAELRPQDAEPWEAVAESYLALGLSRDAANALRKASVRHQKNGFSDQAQAALRRARGLEDPGSMSGARPPPPAPAEPTPAPSEEDIDSLVREGLKLDLELSSEELEAMEPRTPTSLGPESAASVHVRPHPSMVPADPDSQPELEAEPESEAPFEAELEEQDTVPPTPARHASLVDAQTQYDPRGSAALEEARKRIEARRIPSENTQSADQDRMAELLEQLKRGED